MILSGVGKVGLHDLSVIEWKDFSDNLVFAKNIESFLGRNKVESLLPEMKEYDPQCQLVNELELSEETLQRYDLVIACNFPLKQAMELNNSCRKVSKYFIASDVRGLTGFIFADVLNDYVYEINK